MKGKDFSRSSGAFSRLELVMVVATLALLAGIALPMLASNRYRSEQISCLNNLRQIGHAFQVWANDHGDGIPCWTSLKEGGTYMSTGDTAYWPGGPSVRNNAWFQFAWISNELATPKILICPSDQGVTTSRAMANDFSVSADGGFLNSSYKNRAVSYMIGIHAFFNSPGWVLSGDRNIRFDPFNSGCASGLNLIQPVLYRGSVVQWTNSIHGLTGNLLFTDGGVEQTSSSRLRNAIESEYEFDNGVVHFINPF